MEDDSQGKIGVEPHLNTRYNRLVIVTVIVVLFTLALGAVLSFYESPRVAIGVIGLILFEYPMAVAMYLFLRRDRRRRRKLAKHAFDLEQRLSSQPFPSETITGLFHAGGIRRGSVVYVTTERIRVNRRKVKTLTKTHIIYSLLALLALAFAFLTLLLLIFSIPVAIGLRLWERSRSRRNWPSLYDLELGESRFEARRGELLSIEVQAPRKLRHGHIKIIPLVGEPIVLAIASRQNFATATNVLSEFEPSKITRLDRFG